MKVKPAHPDAIVRDPFTRRPLPAEGADVPNDTFWNRRLLDGSVVRVEEHAKPSDREVERPSTTRGGK